MSQINARIASSLYETPSFYETIKTHEAKHKRSYWNFDDSTLHKITNDRLIQLTNVSRRIQGKLVVPLDNAEFIEEFQATVPLMSRDEYNHYMDPTTGSWPVAYNPYTWVDVLSGGTSTGVPTVTRIHMNDAYGASGMGVLNYSHIFNTCRIRRYWDTLMPSRVYLQYGYWHNREIDFYGSKVLDAQGLQSVFNSFQPEAINGSTYAVCKQLSYAKELTGITDMEEKFNQLSIYMTGGEFITQAQKDHIKEHYPNAVHLSRYASSQAYYNMAFGLPQLEQKWHLVMDNVVFLEVVDSEGRPVADGGLGEVVITPLNLIMRPILRFRLGDLAYMKRDHATGRKYIKLMGRADSIIIINSQKIPCTDLLDVMYEKLKTIAHISTNGVGQIRRKKDGSFVFIVETTGDISHISSADYAELISSVTQRLKAIALSLNLPQERTVDGFTFLVELVRSGTIGRHGIREKIRLFIDENA